MGQQEDAIYSAIGKFQVSFQWIEQKYREIGWFIHDPERKQWPPRILRSENNKEIIDKVTKMLLDLISTYNPPLGEDVSEKAKRLQIVFHEFRKFRNTLTHASFIEFHLEAPLTIGISNKINFDLDGSIITSKPISADTINNSLAEIARDAFELGQIYIQLIHWYPFERHKNFK